MRAWRLEEAVAVERRLAGALHAAEDRGLHAPVDDRVIHSLEGPLHGLFSRELAPVLTIDPGDTVVFTHAGLGLGPGALRRAAPYRPRRELERDGDGHALTGPVRSAARSRG